MTIRTQTETVIFHRSFRLKGIDRVLPAGAYQVSTDDEMLEGLSFPCYRRVATMIMIPGDPPYGRAMEMHTISATDLSEALRNDEIAP